MVDRVYKADLPRLRKALEGLKESADSSNGPRFLLARKRIDSLLKHVESLEGILHSKELGLGDSRLRGGVIMFRSDLVYLRLNVKELERLLHSRNR